MKQCAVAVRAVALRGRWLVRLSVEGTGSGEVGVRSWRGVEEARRARDR